MRSLDECKAEILRRSEIKIRRRKHTRNRILAACIPLCLCVGIGAAGVISGGFGAKSENIAAAPESIYKNGSSTYLHDEAVGEDVQTSAIESTRPLSGIMAEEPPGDPATGQQVITLNGTAYVIGAEYDTLKDILQNLEYAPHKVCRCLPQYRLTAPFGSYGIHLTEGYARCEAGQASLSAEQRQTLRQIFDALTESAPTE